MLQETLMGNSTASTDSLHRLKGGEVCTWTGVTYGGSDVAAADIQDGYTERRQRHVRSNVHAPALKQTTLF